MKKKNMRMNLEELEMEIIFKKSIKGTKWWDHLDQNPKSTEI